MDNSDYYVLGSENFNDEMPKEGNIWKYIYPYFEKWSGMGFQYYINGSTGETLSYESMLSMALCWSNELRKYYKDGSPPNVLTILHNSAEYLACIHGCFAIGAQVCLSNFERCVVHEYIRDVMLKELKPTVIVVDSESSLTNIKKALEELNLDVTPTIYVTGISVPSEFNSLDRVLYSKEELSLEYTGQFISAKTCLIIFSSGTTGTLKCIPVSSKNLVMIAHAICYQQCCWFTSTTNTKPEVLFTNSLMSHIFGGVLQFCILGPKFGCQVLDYNEINPVKIYEAIKKYKPSVFVGQSLVLNHFGRFEEYTAEGLNSLRVAVTAGYPANTEAIYALRKKTNNKLIIQDCYGMTEIGAIAITPSNQKKLEMSGIILPGVKVRFVNLENGEDVTKPYQRGELFVISRGLTAGYISNPEANAKSFTSDGWFRTGDIGYFDEENFIKVDDRIKDVITVGKRKVFPITIENLIMEHPSVKEVGVVGTIVSGGNEAPKAFIVKQKPLEAEEIHAFIQNNGTPEMTLLGGIEFIDQIPRNNLGKVLRIALERWGKWVAKDSYY